MNRNRNGFRCLGRRLLQVHSSRGWLLLLLLVLLLALTGRSASAQSTQAEIMQQVAFEQKLGQMLPLDLRFEDSTGATVKLADYFGEKPVILILVYYECPMLCTLELNGLVRSLKTLDLTAGDDFHVITVSFDPGETPALAAKKRERYLGRYDRAAARHGWRFLTGDEHSIDELCDAVGFHPVYDAQRDEYAHAAGVTVLTPQGKIARYFFGIDYPARDLQLGLVEASKQTIGTTTDQLLLLCYGYDPASGRYGFAIINFIRLGGALTVIALGAFIGLSIYRDRRSRRPEAAPPTP